MVSVLDTRSGTHLRLSASMVLDMDLGGGLGALGFFRTVVYEHKKCAGGVGISHRSQRSAKTYARRRAVYAMVVGWLAERGVRA